MKRKYVITIKATIKMIILSGIEWANLCFNMLHRSISQKKMNGVLNMHFYDPNPNSVSNACPWLDSQ